MSSDIKGSPQWRVEPPAESRAEAVGAAVISNRQKVESKLARLQESGRLAYHAWEDADCGRGEYRFQFPIFTHEFLAGTDAPSIAADIPQKLIAGSMPLLSMSLLLSRSTNTSIAPYHANPSEPAYLFNLDQTIEHPAKILSASTVSVNSGMSPLQKQLKLSYGSSQIPALAELYDLHDETDWKKRVAADPAGDDNLSAKQLDALHHYYSSTATPEHRKLECNEIIVAATQQHVAAIALPYSTVKEDPFIDPGMRLFGAIAGLQHLDRGIDLPVVFYQTSYDNSPSLQEHPQGSIFYLGQGRQELSRIALESLQQLQEAGFMSRRSAFWLCRKTSHDLINQVVMHEFGVDLKYPMYTQKQALKKLQADAGIGGGMRNV